MTSRTLEQAKSALNAMLTHMGMDEDEWNKPSFDQARTALAAIEAELAKPDEPAVDDNRTAPPYLKTAEAPPRGDLWVSESKAEHTEPVMANGFTEAETNATASVAGLRTEPERAVFLQDSKTKHYTVVVDPQRDGFEMMPRTEPVALTDERIKEIYHAFPGTKTTGFDYAIPPSAIAFARALIAAAIPPGHCVVPVELVDAAKQALTMMIRCNTPFSTEYDEAMTALGDALAARPKP